MHDRAIKINYRINDQTFRLIYLLFNNKCISRRSRSLQRSYSCQSQIHFRLDFLGREAPLEGDRRYPSKHLIRDYIIFEGRGPADYPLSAPVHPPWHARTHACPSNSSVRAPTPGIIEISRRGAHFGSHSRGLTVGRLSVVRQFNLQSRLWQDISFAGSRERVPLSICL